MSGQHDEIVGLQHCDAIQRFKKAGNHAAAAELARADIGRNRWQHVVATEKMAAIAQRNTSLCVARRVNHLELAPADNQRIAITKFLGRRLPRKALSVSEKLNQRVDL